MKTGQKRIFTPEKIEEMVALRKQGYSFPLLGKKFNCDHSSVIYQYKKYLYLEKLEHKRIMGTIRKKNKKETHKRKYPKQRSRGIEFCPKCEMRLDSDYHIEFPC